MEEKFKQIESKKELYTEISVLTGRTFGTIKDNWFNPINVPEAFEELVEKIIDRRIEMQKIVKRVEEKFFKDHPIKI